MKRDKVHIYQYKVHIYQYKVHIYQYKVHIYQYKVHIQLTLVVSNFYRSPELRCV